MALRLAGSGKFFQDLLNFVKPSSKTDALFRYAPDLFFAGMAAANAPEGTSAGHRALIGLEDAAIGLGGSLLLGGGARAAGKRFLPNATPERIDQLGMVGDMAAMVPAYFAPRPAFMSALEQAAMGQQAQGELQQQLSEERLQQNALAALLQGGALLS
jgi:hypothetical protein